MCNLSNTGIQPKAGAAKNFAGLESRHEDCGNQACKNCGAPLPTWTLKFAGEEPEPNSCRAAPDSLR